MFFAGLGAKQFENIAQGDDGSYLTHKLIKASRDLISRHAWRDIQPQEFLSFKAVRNIELTQAEWAAGAGQSLRFAQKLGIGSHVPCILVFTDIGDLVIHILPFGGRSPNEVYRHVRQWIDSYYEINHDILDYWSAVEDELLEVCTRAAGSLRAVQDWPERCRQDSENLVNVAALMRALADGKDTSIAQLSRLTWASGLPEDLRGTLLSFKGRFSDLDDRARNRATLADLADELSALRNEKEISVRISALAQKPPSYLPSDVLDLIRLASSSFGSTKIVVSPEKELLTWQEEVNHYLSKGEFFRWRSGWRTIADARRLTTESIGDHKRRDFAAFRTAVGDQPVNQPALAAADAVLANLAEHYDVPADSQEWRMLTADFRAFLAGVFRRAQITAPAWLLDGSPRMLLRDSLDTARHEAEQSAWVPEHPPTLQAAIEREKSMRTSRATHRAPVTPTHLCIRDSVSGAIREHAERPIAIGNERRSAFAALSTVLEKARADLETRVLSQCQASSERVPGQVDSADIARLSSAMQNYHKALRHLTYPHLADADIIQIRARVSLVGAAGLTDAHTPARSDLLADSILKADQARRLWPDAKAAARRYSPAAMLADSLAVSLTAPRQRDILGTRPGENLLDKVTHAIRHREVNAVLASMTRKELDQAFAELRQQDAPDLSPSSIRSEILTALGLRSDPDELDILDAPENAAEILKNKITSGDFDVFMAHNSADKEPVLNICKILRKQGIYPWIDIEQTPPGVWFQDPMQLAIRTVPAAAIFLGKGGTGPWQETEIRSFISRLVRDRVTIIPVLLPGQSQVPQELTFLRELQYVRFESTIFETSALKQLIWGITSGAPR